MSGPKDNKYQMGVVFCYVMDSIHMSRQLQGEMFSFIASESFLRTYHHRASRQVPETVPLDQPLFHIHPSMLSGGWLLFY